MQKAKNTKRMATEEALTPIQRYSLRLCEFEKFYLTVVLLCAAAVFVGIAVAILFNLLIGVASALLAASVYVYFVCDEAREQLGIRYKNIGGYIVITKLVCVYGDCLILPPKFIYADVRKIDGGALAVEQNGELRTLYLPASLTHIGKDIFGDAQKPLTVCFEGTREQWESIEKATDFSHCTLLFECEYPKAEQAVLAKDSPADNSRESGSEVDK